MDYYYDDGTQACGPVDEEGLRALISTGTISADTHVWREGMAEWQRLGELLPDLLPAPNPTGPSDGSPSAAEEINFVVCSQCQRTQREENVFRIQGEPICATCKPVYLQRLREGSSSLPAKAERLRLVKVARAQRGIIRCILLFLLLILIVGVLSPDGRSPLTLVLGLALITIRVMEIVYVYQLAAALESSVPLLWALGVLCVGVVSLILLLILIVRATRTLRTAGIRVGLLGADLRALEAELQNG